MQHRLDINEQIILTVKAKDKYSSETLRVEIGWKFHAWCPGRQRWVDLFIPSSPAGYNNPIANMVGQRVSGTKCFCLCGAYNKDDRTAFEIGRDKIITSDADGELSFFANDVPGFDWNNWGAIHLSIRRLA